MSAVIGVKVIGEDPDGHPAGITLSYNARKLPGTNPEVTVTIGDERVDVPLCALQDALDTMEETIFGEGGA